MDVKEGKKTTEFKIILWVTTICGALGAAMTFVVGTGAVDPDSTVGAIMAGAIPILAALAGASGVGYAKVRSAVKISASGGPEENPTVD